MAERPPGDGRSDDEAPPSGWKAAKVAEVLGLAFVFPLATVGGFLVGGWLGERLGHHQAGAVLGGVVGFVGGLFELYRFLAPRPG